MQLPDYSVYAHAIEARNALILLVGGFVLFAMALLTTSYISVPRFSRLLTWFAIGVYYATMALMVVYWFSESPAG